MAFLKDYKKQIPGLSDPVVVKNAYWRVYEISGDKNEIHVNFEILESKESTETIGVFATYFTPDASGVNYHAQAYEHIKSMDNFSDTVDA